MYDRWRKGGRKGKEGGREQQKERAGRDLAGEAETRRKEKVVKEWRGGRRKEGEREGRWE